MTCLLKDLQVSSKWNDDLWFGSELGRLVVNASWWGPGACICVHKGLRLLKCLFVLEFSDFTYFNIILSTTERFFTYNFSTFHIISVSTLGIVQFKLRTFQMYRSDCSFANEQLINWSEVWFLNNSNFKIIRKFKRAILIKNKQKLSFIKLFHFMKSKREPWAG